MKHMFLYLLVTGIKSRLMYSVTNIEVIKGIEGRRIIQITFNVNTIALYFDGGYIQFSGPFVFAKNKDVLRFDEVYPVKRDYGLLTLLENNVTSVEQDETHRNLIFKFETGATLELIGDDGYESYLINIDGKEIRV